MEIHELFPRVLLSDFLRYFIAASTTYILFWVFFKKQWQHRIIQKKSPKAQKMWMEFGYSMSTVLIFTIIGTFIAYSKSLGYTQIYDQIPEYGWGWFGASFVVMALIHDAYFYWAHRLMHHPKIFRYVHSVHHRSTNPSPWAAYSFHPLEALIEAGIFLVIVFTLPVHGLALFLFLLHMISRNVLGHLGIELFPKWFVRNKWLNWLTTTTHHDLHHKNFNGNYGLYFTWWDKWFGTEDKHYIETFEEVTSRKKSTVSNIGGLTPLKNGKIMGLFLFFFSPLILAQSPIGVWQAFDEDTQLPLANVKIEAGKNGLKGSILQLHLQPWQGTNPICSACSGTRKDKPVVGMTFFWGFDKKGNNGKILDPANGEVYHSKMWLEGNKKLKVRGYAGPMNLFYRTQTWKLQEAKGQDGSFEGIWKTIDDHSGLVRSLVKIFEENGEWKGKILQLFLQPREGENPVCWGCSGERNNVPIVGMNILWNFVQKNSTTWSNGKIYDPISDKMYNSTIWLENKNTLKVRGYWGIFYRTQTWKRWNGNAPSNS